MSQATNADDPYPIRRFDVGQHDGIKNRDPTT